MSFEQLKVLQDNYGPIEEIYKLGPMQQGLHYHAISEPNSYSYFVQISYELEGQLNLQSLKSAFIEIVKRHGVLRTVFRTDLKEEPLQIVLESQKVDFRHIDLSSNGNTNIEEQIHGIKESDKAEGFDLDYGPLVRLTIIKLAEERYIQIWSNHHIILDGWSTQIVLNELNQIYKNLCRGERSEISIRRNFKDYIFWLLNSDFNKNKNYWKNYLSNYTTSAVIPSEKKHENFKKRYSIFNHDVRLTGKLTQDLRSLAVEKK